MTLVESANQAQLQAEIDKETNKLVKAYSESDLDKQRSISIQIRKDLFTSDSPRNAEELYKYLEVTYKLKLATTVSNEKWTSPFEWAHALYFDKYPTLLAVAPRGSGKTYGASVITYDKCAHRQNYSAIHVGSRLDQADVAQQYLTNFSNDPALNDGLDRKGVGKKRADWISTYANWKIVSGTVAGVSGQHPQMLSIDEIEFAEEQMIEQSWAVPAPRDDWPRLWAGFSTRQKASSMMSKLTSDAESGKKKIKLMQWSIFEVMQPCITCKALDQHPHGGTPEVEAARCEACPLWQYCRGELNRKSTGWMTLDQVCDTMSTMNEDSIQTQLLCLRPSTHGVVLHNFRHEHSTGEQRNKGNYFPWLHQPDLPFYVWVDPAETKKGCMLLVQILGNRIFAFDEIVDTSGPTSETQKADLYKKCVENGYGEPKAVVIDFKRPDARKVWLTGTLEGEGKDHYFNAVHANMKGGMDDIEAGLDLVRTYILNGLGERKFFVNPTTCPKYVDAITNNMYKVGKDNEIHSTTKQAEKFKDEVDSIRNGIIYHHRNGFGASV